MRQSLWIIALLFVVAYGTPAYAATVIDDHFAGTNPGIPPGWSEGLSGPVVAYDDSGATTVSLSTQNGRAVIISDTAFGVQAGVSWTVEIDNLFGNGQISSGFSNADFAWRLTHGSGNMEAMHPNGLEFLSVGAIPGGYNGGPIHITTDLTPTTFRITSDTGFDSGSLPWSSFTTGYELTDTVGDVGITVQVDAGAVTNTGVFDRVTVDAVPEPSALLLAVVAAGGLLATTRKSRRDARH